MKASKTGRFGAVTAIRLVVGREVEARVANRSFVLGTLVSAAIIVGLLWFLAPSTSQPHSTVAVAGTTVSEIVPDAASGTVEWRGTADEASARHLLAGKDVDAALIVDGARTHLLTRNDTAPSVRDSVTAMVQRWATMRALHARNVDMGGFARDVATSLPQVEVVDPTAADGAEIGVVVGIVTVLFFQLFAYGMMVSQGVVEEKSTRVVEVLLSTLTPLRLMVGKVLGIGVAGLIQLVVFGGAALGTVAFGHVLPSQFPAASTILVALGWFFLGYLFFAFLFAAAGSLVSRVEDVSATVMPILLLVLVPYGVTVAACADLSSSWVQVIRYLPPFSMLMMPVEVSAHAAGWGENAIAVVLMITAIWALAATASRVYGRSILRVGMPVRWREALRTKSR